jgi:succinyl-CoA synthetase alpha subunit
MSIFVDENTRVLCQGLTGRAGGFHAAHCMAYGTRIVAGVTPGRGGQTWTGEAGGRAFSAPVFDAVEEAVRATGADASIVFVPAPHAADAVMEAARAGIRLIVCITEGIPVWDAARLRPYCRERGTTLIGPNCPGIIAPAARCKIGIMPGRIHRPGAVGVVSRSGTLTYEAVWQITRLGLGQSTCVGIGGDPLIGTGFVEVLERFNADTATQAVALIGEIGGEEEEAAAEYIRREMKKPVAAFIAGASAPPERRMGHAGAIISGGRGGAAAKIEALRSAGVVVAASPAEIGDAVRRAMAGRRPSAGFSFGTADAEHGPG